MLVRNQEFVRGDRFLSEIYEIWDVEAGEAKDVSGYSFTSRVKVSPIDTDVLFSFTVTKVQAASGLIRLSCLPSATENIELVNWRNGPTAYVYDVEMVNNGDSTDKETVLGGAVLLRADVT